MSEYDIALDNQVEWVSFWTSGYGIELYRSIGRVINSRRIEKGEKSPESIVNGEDDLIALKMLPLVNSECFYWSRDMIDLVSIAASSLPDSWTLTKQHIPTPGGFFWLAKEPLPEQYKGIRAIGWTLLATESNKEVIHLPQQGNLMPDFSTIVITIFVGNADFPKPIPCLAYMDVGYSLDDWRLDMRDRAVRMNADIGDFMDSYHSLRLFASMLSFIQQRILVTSRYITSRSTRRRAAFSQRLAEPEVNVVKLRRVVQRAHRGEGVSVDWQCRWIVHGHWRDQWYPSVKKNQPIWITPYVKGPEGKPLRDPGRLFAVVR